jgi:hypothetical protein
MRSVTLGLFAVGFGAAGSLMTTGCGSSCDDTGSCGAYQGGAAGTGGTSGTGGTAGGTGGTAGAAGGGGTTGGGGTGATGGTAGSGGDGGTCDTTKTPSAEACLVDDQYAVFVDGTVATSGDGTKATPFKTIAEGVAAAGGKFVVVCDTSYDEQVKLSAGVKLYGGFKCADWSYETGVRAVVKPTAKGYALEVDSVTDAVLIEDMEFDSADGSAAGESSIAAFVHGSNDVTLNRDRFAAGKGIKGADGVLSTYTFPASTALNGNAANTTQGGAAKTYTLCPGGGTTTGGAGGSAPLQAGGPGVPDYGAGQGGSGASCGGGGIGKDGNPAPAATAAAGAGTSGALTASGFTPANGSDGGPGGPGQGGGGGAADASGGGDSGAAGGCGGAGGTAGKGGGASIALLLLDSTVSVDAGSELVTGSAGDGGKGAAGQPGMATGGNGGFPSALGGCQGGKGGGGGAGSSGGGAAGGVSVPVVWKGATAPNIDASATLTPGTKGNKGVGGTAGSNDGIDGVAQATLEVS